MSRTQAADMVISAPTYVVLLLMLAALLLHRHTGSPARGWRNFFLVMALVLYLTSAPAVSNALVARLEWAPEQPEVRGEPDVVVLVLTAGWARLDRDGYESSLGQAGWERLWTGVQAWKRIGGKLMFSGAPLPDGKGSVAEVMAARARTMGVPDEAMVVETRSRSTYENLVNSWTMLKATGTKRVVLVTSAIHMQRAVAVASRLGIPVIPYPCDYRTDLSNDWARWLPSSEGLGNMEQVVHELVGLFYYRVRGWA